MNYQEMNNKVESFRSKFSGKLVSNNTRVSMNNDIDKLISVKLHNTHIVVFHPCGDITLNTDGWQTVTTKSRINEYLPSGYRLFQKKGEWYLETPNHTFEYTDRMSIYKSKLSAILES